MLPVERHDAVEVGLADRVGLVAEARVEVRVGDAVDRAGPADAARVEADDVELGSMAARRGWAERQVGGEVEARSRRGRRGWSASSRSGRAASSARARISAISKVLPLSGRVVPVLRHRDRAAVGR